MAMGRPRAFCVDKALDAALEVFWRKGFDGASLTELTQAMGINRPSLYAAFGNKEELFRKALDRYVCVKVAYLREALAAPDAYGVAERLLMGAAAMMTDPTHPVGCLTVKGLTSCTPQSESVKAEVEKIYTDYEQAMLGRLAEAQAAGQIPRDADLPSLFRYLSTIIQGMAIQSSTGATRADLEAVARTALTAWPARQRVAESVK